MNERSDQAIVGDVLCGDRELFGLLVGRHQTALIRHLVYVVGDGTTAEDIAQEAFIRAYVKLKQYNPAYAFSTWLYTIADRLAYRHVHKLPVTELTDAMEATLPSHLPQPTEVAEHALTTGLVRAAIGQLPVPQQRVVIMYYWDGLSYEDIARVIGRPIGTIRTWLHRAKLHLRKELDGRI